ncbi:hypothetical protein Atai01_46940 [Amycolatopsis taiwanensis]|uniref:Uncharacterized protein n=1 Tax=Amycolatopsis taiwanensis TaxID=342230 RepID=A0A9W6VGT2_9PSEU|nr:hypothetical protein Atai01_46940 [Amycolatopsis taiwanensis]
MGFSLRYADAAEILGNSFAALVISYIFTIAWNSPTRPPLERLRAAHERPLLDLVPLLETLVL